MSLHDAREDLRDLLNKDYKKKMALDFVCNHYSLKKEDRNILARTTYSKDVSAETMGKESSSEDLNGEELLIDAYNVIITIESVLFDDPLVCDDGVVRDGRGVFGKYEITEKTVTSLERINDFLKKKGILKAVFFIDKNVSKSGDLASAIRAFDWDSDVDAILSEKVDSTLRSKKALVATADYGIIKYVDRFVDIPKSLLFTW